MLIDSDKSGIFDTLVFILSVLVIGGMSAEFIGMAFGLINANELLIVCSIGAIANLVIFRLSKKALSDRSDVKPASHNRPASA